MSGTLQPEASLAPAPLAEPFKASSSPLAALEVSPLPLTSHQIQFLCSILSGLPDGVAVSDPNGKILFSNAAFSRWIDADPVGVPPERWPAAYGFFRLDGQTLLPAEEFPLVGALRGKASRVVEVFLRNPRVPEGIWISFRGLSLKGEDGTLWGSLVILRDVTEIRRLQKEILDISGREQRRIGQDLHDGVCQILTGLKFMCNAAIRRLNSHGTSEGQDWVEVQTLISQALREADGVAKGLFPVELEANGLVPALRELASRTRKLYRVSCLFLCDQPVTFRNQEVALHIYRIVQEAIANALKHGHAKNIMIWLVPGPDGYSLMVKNDGTKAPDAPLREGMGWRIMNYRSGIIGASLHFEFQAAGGAMLTCEFKDLPSEE